jgi:hypothetical protein
MAYTSEALQKENVNKRLEGAAVGKAVFAIQLSILNRMSFLAGFDELGRPAFSSQSGKRGTVQVVLAGTLRISRLHIQLCKSTLRSQRCGTIAEG